LDQTYLAGFKKRRVHGAIIPLAKAHGISLELIFSKEAG
jgi:hypothetical protein